MGLTDKECQKRATGKEVWKSDGGARGGGNLWFRISRTGTRTFYFRYTGTDGERARLPLGEYDATGRAGLTLAKAREVAGEHSKLYRSGIKDVREHLARDEKARERARKDAEAAARQAEVESKRGTLGALLDGYLTHLERRGKRSVREARYAFENHVRQPFPELCERKANSIKAGELRQVLARLTDAGKGRQAGKTRAYIRAAFAAAIGAEHDPTAPAALLGFGLEGNPADVLPALSQFNKEGDRHLSETELRAYLAALDALPSRMTRAALRLALLLGGQRASQLLRVSALDVNLDAGTITLRDGKGRRKQDRLHVLPMPPSASVIVAGLLEINATAPSLFSTNGRNVTRLETLSESVHRISAALFAAGATRAPFSLRDIRRTCETMLARMGISSDLRAQILSHGLGGVQQKHYDRHDYHAEKSAALLAWERRLIEIREGESAANVLPLKRTA